MVISMLECLVANEVFVFDNRSGDAKLLFEKHSPVFRFTERSPGNEMRYNMTPNRTEITRISVESTMPYHVPS